MTVSSIALELLETDVGQVLQTWELVGGDLFQLGRSPDSDVVLASPYVSRTHACLRRSDGDWELSAVSRFGVFVDGERVETLRMENGLVFRLAETGPFLRFRSGSSRGGDINGETMCADVRRTPVFVLDEQQRDREVNEITTGDYFQELQRKLALLRSRPSSTDETAPRKPN